jgi:hypothetical protein
VIYQFDLVWCQQFPDWLKPIMATLTPVETSLPRPTGLSLICVRWLTVMRDDFQCAGFKAHTPSNRH